MDQNALSKEIADGLLKKKGFVLGKDLLSLASFVREKEGDGGLTLVKDELKIIGNAFDFDKVDPASKYSIGIIPIIILILKNQMNWEDIDISELGRSATKPSVAEDVFWIRHFTSLEKSFEKLPERWRESFDIGELEKVSFNRGLKQAIVRIKNFDLHPIICRYLEGFIMGAFGRGANDGNVLIKEKKCFYKGEGYDEFVLDW